MACVCPIVVRASDCPSRFCRVAMHLLLVHDSRIAMAKGMKPRNARSPFSGLVLPERDPLNERCLMLQQMIALIEAADEPYKTASG